MVIFHSYVNFYWRVKRLRVVIIRTHDRRIMFIKHGNGRTWTIEIGGFS